MKMIETILMQPLAAISAFVFVVILARAFWLSMRTRRKENRKDRFEIRPLTPSETVRFTEAWESLRRRSADNPRWTISEVEQLAREVMQRRGYPTRNFERRSAAIAFDHPNVVANYRAAQAIALRVPRDAADLRRAMVYYRALFDELLAVSPPTATADKLLAGENA